MRLNDKNTRKGRHLTPEERIALQAQVYKEIKQLQQENNSWQKRYDELDAGHSRLFKDFCKLQQENEQLQELTKARADGRMIILPAKPGDIIYRPEALQFCWVITKVEIYEDEIVFIDDSDNIFRPGDIGKTVFLSREAAEKAIGGGKK